MAQASRVERANTGQRAVRFGLETNNRKRIWLARPGSFRCNQRALIKGLSDVVRRRVVWLTGAVIRRLCRGAG